jgi:hypothetical protein
MATRHVNKSLRTIDENTWAVGEKYLLSRERQQTEGGSGSHAWKDDEGWYYALTEPIEPLPPPHEIEQAVPFPLVYDAGGMTIYSGHAVWKVGNAFLKIIVPDSPLATREHVTLQELSTETFSFEIPKVLFHGEWAGRYHIVLSEIPGKTVIQAWWEMTENEKQACAQRVADACKELAAWRQNSQICGLDGKQLSENGFAIYADDDHLDFSPEYLQERCAELGMTCSSPFEFYHCDLSPGNVIWNGLKGGLGIIDWERAGFVPKEWIRTNFIVAPGMSLDRLDHDGNFQWAVRMFDQLGDEGFPEVSDIYVVDRKRRWAQFNAGELS